MDRETAEKLMAKLDSLAVALNDLVELTETIQDPEEQRKYRSMLGNIMGEHFELMLPAIQQYPELDPDKDSAWFKKLKQNREGTQS